MSTIDLLTIGDNSIDLYMKVDGASVIPEDTTKENPKICFYHGSKVHVNAFKSSIAGNACHVSAGCKNLGLSVAMYSELGDDTNADRFISEFKERGISTDYIIKNKGTPTNVHAVIVFGEERTIFDYHEPRTYKLYDWPTPKWIYYSSLSKGFEKFQGELVSYLKKNPNIGVGFNPGTLQLLAGLESLRDFLSVTHVLIVNVQEAQSLLSTKETDLMELHKMLNALGPKLSVITDSKKGSSAFDGNELVKVGIYGDGSGVVDKTGAGDAYSSGLISGLFYKKPLKTAMQWGMINSSYVVKEIGGIHGLRTLEEMEKLQKALTQ